MVSVETNKKIPLDRIVPVLSFFFFFLLVEQLRNESREIV